MGQKIPLMMVPESISEILAIKFKGIGKKMIKFFPNVETEILMTDIDLPSDEYLAKSLVNASTMGSIFSLLLILLFWSQGKTIEQSIIAGLGIGVGIILMFMLIFSKYPGILAEKKAESVNKDLVFALKDLSLQISAGVNLYDSFVAVANSNYGDTSNEFKKVIQNINSGKPMADALEEMALKSKSEYLKRTSWQIVNTLKAGSNIKKTLKRIISDLANEQRTRIRNYARELNLWSLIYMLFAVAVPSIGSTMLVILSSFAGFGITKNMFIFFIIMCFIIQYILIGFVKTRRPVSNI